MKPIDRRPGVPLTRELTFSMHNRRPIQSLGESRETAMQPGRALLEKRRRATTCAANDVATLRNSGPAIAGRRPRGGQDMSETTEDTVTCPPLLRNVALAVAPEDTVTCPPLLTTVALALPPVG